MEDLRRFSRRDPTSGQITAIVLIHVDDIAMAGTAAEMAKCANAPDTFAHGPIGYISPDLPVTYCGLGISRVCHPYGLSQDAYRSNGQVLRPSEFLGPRAIHRAPEKKKSKRIAFLAV